MSISGLRLRVAVSAMTVLALGSAEMLASCGGDDSTTSADAGGDAAPDQGATDASPGDGGNGDSGSDGGVEASTRAIGIAAGTDQACALMDDHTVRCWGSNFYGESGQPRVVTDAGGGDPILAPAKVPSLSGVSSLSLGAYHSCALTSGGQVFCWGSDQFGQLAQATDGGDQVLSTTPVQVTLSGTIQQVSAGFYHTCVRASGGSVQCWGENDTSQIGATSVDGGSLGDFVVTPTAAAISGVTSLDVGGRFACAILGDGGVSCWGDNGQGQLGRGGPPFTPPDSTPTPAPIVGLPFDAGVASVGRSTAYSEALVLTNKTVVGWGFNGLGELGPGVAAGQVGTPTASAALTGVVEIGLGYGAACALLDDGSVACWGGTGRGVTGSDPADAGSIQVNPHKIAGLTDATHIAVGWDNFACALRKTGAVVCWGDNATGELGRGKNGTALPFDPVPAPVKF